MKSLEVCPKCGAVQLRIQPQCQRCGFNRDTGRIESLPDEPLRQRPRIFEDILDVFAELLERLRHPRRPT